MLTADAIQEEMRIGNIRIHPYRPEQLNANSYNLKLDDKLLIIEEPLDMKRSTRYRESFIPKDGYMLVPNTLYLAQTLEYTESRKFIPEIGGRSSIGRLGICVHQTAGFGDIGFKGNWTLELSCVVPVRIYPFVEICQIYFTRPDGYVGKQYEGKYQNQHKPLPSQIHRELV